MQDDLKSQLVECATLPYDLADRRNPRRFFDPKTAYVYDQKQAMLVTPAFRVEYFDQLIQFNQHIIIDLQNPNEDLVINMTTHFLHSQKQLPKHAQSFAKSTTVFTRQVLLGCVSAPGLQGWVEHFGETHFSQFQMCFAWDGPGFRDLYRTDFENFTDLSSADQLLLIQNDIQTQNKAVLANMQTVEPSDIQELTPFTGQTKQSKSNLRSSIYAVEQNNVSETPTNLQIRAKVPPVQRVQDLLSKPKVVKIAHNSLKLKINQFYSAEQTEFIEKYMQRVRKIAQNVYVVKEKALFDGKKVVYIFVHGYKGSSNDLRYLKDQIQSRGQTEAIYIMCAAFYGQNTSILQLAKNLQVEIKRKITEELGGLSWEQTIEQILEINFIGFSLGCLVIEGWLAAEFTQIVDDQSTDFCEKFAQLPRQQHKQASKLPLFQKPKSLLFKLNALIQVNGPLLGSQGSNGLVAMGSHVLSKHEGNECINDLENQPISFNQKSDLYFEQEFMLSGLFQQIKVLDLLAFSVNFNVFNKHYILGTKGDGYVNFESSLGLRESLLCIKHDDKQNRILLVPGEDRLKTFSSIDQTTGRAGHICIISDVECTEILASLILTI
ncbi:Putative_serine esterase [Hexamita inflata]|uniref:Serine esterase n=1 Tax=Hexamita inflata TaxID=28002 RepID=A0AA86QL42_9EUKA|nr:Putative serine esterase [Hexamita inflata]